MSAKSEQNYAMTAAVLDIRQKAKDLVDRAENRTRSRMVAYEDVASSIGMSSGWVRGFVANDPRYTIKLVIALNITALYERTCNRVESNSERHRQEIQDAANQGNRNQYRIEAEACMGSRALLPPNEF